MPNNDFLEKASLLSSNPLFVDLDQEELYRLAAATNPLRLNGKQVVFNQGDPGDEMFLIASGSVKVSVLIAEDEEVTLRELETGEAFGEIALFDSRERTAKVTTLEPTTLLGIKRPDFLRFLTTHPNVAIQLLTTLSRRLRSINDLVIDTLSFNIGSRLAETLHKISRVYGRHTPKGVRIDTQFSDRELGEIAGVPSEVVAAQLRHWRNEGILTIAHGYITIIKPDELRHLVH